MRARSTAALSALLVGVCVIGGNVRSDQHEALSLEQVFDSVHTSVVTLYTEGETGLRDQEGVAQLESNQGSGVLLEGGRILTAAHVVHTADVVVVEYADGTRVRGRVIGSVVQGDVALLQVDEAPPSQIRPAVLGDSDGVRVGSVCFVGGAPRGLTHTLTVGHISARRSRDHPLHDLLDTEHFQTDASINPGNSGGPMFDMNGRVIGIVSFIRSATRESAGLGFAVTSNTARRLLLERNPIWSGMTETFLTGPLARAFQIPEGRSGYLLQRVAKGSPADRMGLVGGSIPATIGGTPILLGGDILLEAMGQRLDSPDIGLALLSSLQDLAPDSRVSVVILRSGQGLKLEAAAGDLAPWLGKTGPGR
jgi:S1-C subfamily serine protease